MYNKNDRNKEINIHVHTHVHKHNTQNIKHANNTFGNRITYTTVVYQVRVHHLKKVMLKRVPKYFWGKKVFIRH